MAMPPALEPAPPPLPPKDPPAHVPASIRFGSNVLGLGLAAANQDASPQKISGGGSSAYTLAASRSRLLPTSESSPRLGSSPETTTPTLPSIGRHYSISTSRSVPNLTPIMSSTSTKSGKSSHTAKVHYDDESLDEWGKKQSSKSDKPSVTLYTPPLSRGQSRRRRASGQLLNGIGRMGSVMRRNTTKGLQTSTTAAATDMGTKSQSWGRKNKPPVFVKEPEDDDEIMITKEPNVPQHDDEGDAGIGRPFNVEHNFHVSPSLDNLPPAWLEKLREEGLTDQDLLLITAARRQQAQVSKIALRPGRPALSEPPTSQSLPTTGHLGLPEDSARTRGASTPGTRKPSSTNRFLHSATLESPVEDPSELPPSTTRTSRRAKRLSDQLRIFSQYDVGGGEDWAAGLLSAVNCHPPSPKASPTSQLSPEKRIPAALDLSATSRWNTQTEPVLPSASSSTSAGESTSTGSTLAQTTLPRTPDTAKTIKRIPIPRLLDPTLTRPLDLEGLSSVNIASPFSTWVSLLPPPPRKHSAASLGTTPLEPPPPKGSPPTPPLRTSSESFGVHYSAEKSQSSVDVSLVTPASVHTARVDDPIPIRGLDDDIALDSPFSFNHRHNQLALPDDEPRRESDTLPMSMDHSKVVCKDRLSLRTDSSLHHSNLSYSVQQSVAPSLPDTSSFVNSSQCSTSDLDMEYAVMHSSELSAAIDTAEYLSSLKPKDKRHIFQHDDRPSPRAGRESLALSMLSSEGSHHEATVHHAYSKILGLKQLDLTNGAPGWRYTRSGSRIREEEESDSGETLETDGKSEAGYSALDALDDALRDAARRIANADSSSCG